MRHKLRFLLILLSISLNVAFIAAWGTKTVTQTATAARVETPPCGKGDSCRIWCPLHRSLGTTDTQWRELEPLQREFQAASQALADSANSHRAALVDLLANPTVDEAALAAAQDNLAAVQRQMQALVVNHLRAEKRILNPEQQATLFALMRDHGGCAGHRGLLGAGAGEKHCPKHQQQQHSE